MGRRAEWERKLSAGHIKANLLALHTFGGNQVTGGRSRAGCPPKTVAAEPNLTPLNSGRQDTKSFKHFYSVAPPNMRLSLCVLLAINSKITIAHKDDDATTIWMPGRRFLAETSPYHHHPPHHHPHFAAVKDRTKLTTMATSGVRNK